MNRVLVVDDEAPSRARLIRLVQAIGGYEVVGEAGNGHEALQRCHALQANIVLLDITMPGMDGLSAARCLARLETPPAVVFCTAHADQALAAFEAQAVGYLVKPVNADKLATTLAQAARLTQGQMQALAQATQSPARQHLVIQHRQGIELLPLAQVRCFRADHKYVEALHPGGAALLSETLKELEDEFGERFIRVHRNALVAVPYIEALERDADGQERLRLNGIDWRPQVSRRQLPDLKQRLLNRI